jgi:hypothetical protein
MDGYGRQTRSTKRKRFLVRRVSTGAPLGDYYGFATQQEVTSFRTPLQGTPIVQSSIDPYWNGLVETDDRSVQDGRLVSPVIVNGKAVATRLFKDTGHGFLKRERSVNTSLHIGTFNNVQNNYVVGGPVCAYKAEIALAHRGRMPFLIGASGDSRYIAGVMPLIPNPGDLDQLGRRAIEVVAPGYPDISVLRTFGELILGFPKIIGRSIEDLGTSKSGPSSLAKASADEFLNFIFGIAPTIQDIDAFIRTLIRVTDKLYQLERDSGKAVRRRMTFDFPSKVEVFASTELSDQGKLSASPNTMFDMPVGSSPMQFALPYVYKSELSMQSTRTASFVGSFTYVLPTDPSLRGQMEQFMDRYERIYGLAPTPERLWQLIPFSWLVDWFLGVQKTLSLNARIYDKSLVINYGYVMSGIYRTVIQRTVVTNPTSGMSARDVSTVYRTFRKERARANPYGFILPSDTGIFDPMRIAILAALGITRRSVN